jgi:hypothetical protein
MNKTEKIKTIIKEEPSLSSRAVAYLVGCSRRLVRKVRQEEGPGAKKQAKILVFDIETSPMEIYVWGLYKQKPNIQQIIKDWSILSWSAKWLFDDTMYGARVSGAEAIERSDESILGELWNLLNEADLVIGHNVQKFDVRKVNLRFALAGLLPPTPYRCIDTMKHAMKVFASSSYKMDYLNKIFGVQMKDDSPYEWWTRSVQGDDVAIQKMFDYNKTDVLVNEELYLKLRPWMKGHPNIGLYIDTDETVCTNCGNDELTWGGHYFTPAGKYKAFRCDSCGAIGRSRTSDLDKETRARLLLSIAS